MKYDFSEMTARRGTGSMKWDSDPDSLPLWVADMDFRTAPAVTEALMRRVESGIFGYTQVPDSYYDALCSWFSRRHGWDIDRSKVIYTSGVVPALSAIIKALTSPGDGVILSTPAYNCFFSCIRNNKAEIVENPLLRTDTLSGFTFGMDFEQLERVASLPTTRLFILCNPHNPSGRVWTREELGRVSDICRANGVTVISDEIHCELVHPGFEYTPYATVDPSAIICCSPSKAFNTAGLQIANIICPDEETRRRVDRAINDNEVCDVNPFGVVALQAAYNDGGEWLAALNAYLFDNYNLLRDMFAAELPLLRVCDSQSTYLAWVDIAPLGISSDEVEERLARDWKVRISAGATYGADGYIRINYACPRRRLTDGLERIIEGIKSLSGEH